MMLAGAGGCGASPPADEGDGSATFVAQNIDFKGFDTWQSLSFDNPNPGGATHVAGKRTVFINHLPPPGATAFPVGTIIVKETQQVDPTTRDVIARAKRGGTFNAEGATGWEWWELKNTAEGKVTMLWRGVAPPVGACSYLTSLGGNCQLCHSGGTDGETVLTPALSLANFK